MVETRSREIHLINRPIGLPSVEDFKIVETAIPPLADGQILVKNKYMSVDPYMRGRMYDRESYVPPFQLNKPLEGGCVGQVVESKGGKFQKGDYVLGMLGWREYFVTDGTGFRTIDPNLAPIQHYLGLLGMPGLTAYVGLLDIGQLKEREAVYVSTAAGAVGSVVCQIAKIKDCHVVGSTGSDEKVAWLLDEVGIDAAFNYKKVKNLTSEIAKHCPKGIDVYYENVGGEHLDAALLNMNTFGRIAICGMISQYNTMKPTGIRNLTLAIQKRLTLKGFIITDHYKRLPDFTKDMTKWLAEGKIKWKETIVDGIENAPAAFIGLFKGKNFGKMIVKL
ncbi:MAG: NADP-dependent oxidoreductase [Candidatus Hermodarchaeota archaeon]